VYIEYIDIRVELILIGKDNITFNTFLKVNNRVKVIDST